MRISFEDRVVVITGAGGALGRNYALFLASRGARVVVNDAGGDKDGIGRSQGPAREVAEEIKAAGGEALASFDDISTSEGARNLADHAVGHFGKVDVLINNAGITRNKSLLKMDLDDFEEVVRVHLLGTVYVTKAVLPLMKERQYGRIVMTTSAAGLYGNFGQTNYGAAKLGIVGFMNCLKTEVERYGITVNTIAPLAASRLGVGIFPPDLMAALKPDYVTAAVAYLCSEQCTRSGAVISAGGGFYTSARMVEGPGVRFDPKRAITPEMIAERYDEITRTDRIMKFDNASEEVKWVTGFDFSF
jgi:NAD(P)-dependent dehydrogenase (short-subunit alcohol dehydrogenase family)